MNSSSKKAPLNRITRFFKAIYLKLFRIHDNPHKIAMGIGVGVFFGIMPGTGPLAALFFAFLLKINRAGALLGSVLANTRLSIPLFLLSLKAGSLATGLKYSDMQNTWGDFLRDFRWKELLHAPVYKVVFPVIVGYAIVSLCAGALAYLTVLISLI